MKNYVQCSILERKHFIHRESGALWSHGCPEPLSSAVSHQRTPAFCSSQPGASVIIPPVWEPDTGGEAWEVGMAGRMDQTVSVATILSLKSWFLKFFRAKFIFALLLLNLLFLVWCLAHTRCSVSMLLNKQMKYFTSYDLSIPPILSELYAWPSLYDFL